MERIIAAQAAAKRDPCLKNVVKVATLMQELCVANLPRLAVTVEYMGPDRRPVAEGQEETAATALVKTVQLDENGEVDHVVTLTLCVPGDGDDL